MSRPAILTETQLRAAVAVAEAERVRTEARHHVGRIGCEIMSRPEFARIVDWDARYDAAMPARLASEEYRAATADFRAAESKADEALGEWMKVRPSGEYEVRAGETLARIVADHTDGGSDRITVYRDTELAQVLREFEGMTARDGVR